MVAFRPFCLHGSERATLAGTWCVLKRGFHSDTRQAYLKVRQAFFLHSTPAILISAGVCWVWLQKALQLGKSK